jgi:hypothetical protein
MKLHGDRTNLSLASMGKIQVVIIIHEDNKKKSKSSIYIFGRITVRAIEVIKKNL